MYIILMLGQSLMVTGFTVIMLHTIIPPYYNVLHETISYHLSISCVIGHSLYVCMSRDCVCALSVWSSVTCLLVSESTLSDVAN